MKIIHWTSNEPPTGFEYGPTPTDFGVGRAAYKFDGDNLLLTIYRGDYIIEHDNGEWERLEQFTGISRDKVVRLLKEAGISEKEV